MHGYIQIKCHVAKRNKMALLICLVVDGAGYQLGHLGLLYVASHF